MSQLTNVDSTENIKKRQDIVLGVCLAVATGFLVNLISSIYYDIFISKTVLFSDISSTALVVPLLLLVFLEAFLEFLIYDVRQGKSVHIDKRFWGRYLDFIDEKHWASKAANSMGRIIWATIKWVVWGVALLSLLSSKEWVLFAILLVATVLRQTSKYGLFRSRKKKVRL